MNAESLPPSSFGTIHKRRPHREGEGVVRKETLREVACESILFIEIDLNFFLLFTLSTLLSLFNQFPTVLS